VLRTDSDYGAPEPALEGIEETPFWDGVLCLIEAMLLPIEATEQQHYVSYSPVERGADGSWSSSDCR
jgi:hypothetical protein